MKYNNKHWFEEIINVLLPITKIIKMTQVVLICYMKVETIFELINFNYKLMLIYKLLLTKATSNKFMRES